MCAFVRAGLAMTKNKKMDKYAEVMDLTDDIHIPNGLFTDLAYIRAAYAEEKGFKYSDDASDDEDVADDAESSTSSSGSESFGEDIK